MLMTKKLILVSICLLAATIGCSPKAPTRRLDLNADKTKYSKPLQEKLITAEKTEEAVVYELTPTYVPYSNYNAKKQETAKVESKVAGKIPPKQTVEVEKIYEKPVKKIKNKQAVINLDSLTMSKVLMRYDQAKRKLLIQGHAQILDDNRKPIADSATGSASSAEV